MKYDKELNKIILENIDEKYASFHSSLVPNTKIKGVTVPKLRKIAKNFAKYDDFLDNITLNNFESISVACYYIGYTTKDIENLKNRLNFILPYIDNWAICDTFVSSLKIIKKFKNEFLSVILKYLDSDSDFTVRFAIVCLLSYYIDENYIDDLFNRLIVLQNKNYYIDMAIAWFVSVSFIKCKEKTIKLLKSKKINKEVKNKSISKICDSFRVSKEDKEFVKTLRY